MRKSDENEGKLFQEVAVISAQNLRQLGVLEEQRENQCVDHSGWGIDWLEERQG